MNPFQRIKDIVDLLINPPGRAIEASVITKETFVDLGLTDVERMPEAEKNLGNYLVRFESDLFTVIPTDEFFKYYAFVGPEDPTGKTLMPIIQIRPL